MSDLIAAIRVPGAFWLAAIAFVMVWLPQIAPAAPWLDDVLLILLALLKAVEVVVLPPPPLPTTRHAGPHAETTTAAFLRWLVG